MLRGPQTPGELRGRSERLHPFASVDEVEETLSRLIEAGLAVRFHRRPGQKEDRFGHLLSSDLDDDGEEPAREEPIGAVAESVPTGNDESSVVAEPTHVRAEVGTPPGLEARVAALEADLRALRRQLADLLED
jgi:uncharacterized protein YceH (UPF0502 family)